MGALVQVRSETPGLMWRAGFPVRAAATGGSQNRFRFASNAGAAGNATAGCRATRPDGKGGDRQSRNELADNVRLLLLYSFTATWAGGLVAQERESLRDTASPTLFFCCVRGRLVAPVFAALLS